MIMLQPKPDVTMADVATDFEPRTVTSWQGRLEELCALLQKNDDGSITQLGTDALLGSIWQRRRATAHGLGQALLSNTTVTHLVVHIDDIVYAAGEENLESEVAPWILYLQTSSSLRDVKLSATHNALPDLVERMVQAVAVNRSVTTVDLANLPFLSSALLVHLLVTTTSITKLMYKDQAIQIDVSTLNQVASAFGVNQTVQDLVIHQRCGNNRENPGRIPEEPILLQLGSAQSTLESLSLHMNEHVSRFTPLHFETIAALLESTKSLERLLLNSYTFNRQSIRPILRALKDNATVTKLCLESFDMNDEATMDFVEFMQQHCNKDNSVLRDVSIKVARGYESFQGHTAGLVLSTMLIGSSLQSLYFSEPKPFGLFGTGASAEMNVFFTALSDNEDQVRLASLRLDYLASTDVDALVEFLPKAQYLCNLDVAVVDRNVRSAPLVTALRENGSLHSVSIMQVDPWSQTNEVLPLFTPDEVRRVQAYGERNRMLPILLHSGPTTPSATIDTVTVDEEAAISGLVPELCVTSRHAGRTCPNNLLIGLLAIDDALDE